MTPGTVTVATWTCDVCQEPIDPDDGFLEFFNADPTCGPVGAYPVPVASGHLGYRIACEVCSTSTLEQELEHARHGLACGYDLVIEFVSKPTTLRKIQALVRSELPESEQSRVLFFKSRQALYPVLRRSGGRGGRGGRSASRGAR